MRGGALFFSLSKSESSNVFSLLRPRCSSSGAFTPALRQTAKKLCFLAVSEEKRAPKRSQAPACGGRFFSVLAAGQFAFKAVSFFQALTRPMTAFFHCDAARSFFAQLTPSFHEQATNTLFLL